MIARSASFRGNWLRPVPRLSGLAVWLVLVGALLGAAPAPAELAGGDPGVRVPGFWDPRRRPERPDLSRINMIRFLTETDYPPFNFTGADGTPAGFNIDLARLICEEIKIPDRKSVV